MAWRQQREKSTLPVIDLESEIFYVAANFTQSVPSGFICPLRVFPLSKIVPNITKKREINVHIFLLVFHEVV